MTVYLPRYLPTYVSQEGGDGVFVVVHRGRRDLTSCVAAYKGDWDEEVDAIMVLEGSLMMGCPCLLAFAYCLGSLQFTMVGERWMCVFFLVASVLIALMLVLLVWSVSCVWMCCRLSNVCSSQLRKVLPFVFLVYVYYTAHKCLVAMR